MKVQLPAILSGVASRKDRSYSLKFETRELSGQSASTLLDLLQSEGFLLFSPNDDFTEADIPDEKANAMLGTKTQAQRLRGVIYRLWEQKGKQGSFDNYYTSVMESLLDQLKEKLD
jgi:hypothetical protein